MRRSGRIRTSDLAIIDATDLFTTDEGVGPARTRGRQGLRGTFTVRDGAFAPTARGLEPRLPSPEETDDFTTGEWSAIRERSTPRRRIALALNSAGARHELGAEPRGNRTRPPALKAKYRMSSPRIARRVGELSRLRRPLGARHALPLSYGRARAHPGGIELRPCGFRCNRSLHHRRTGWARVDDAGLGDCWGTGDFGFFRGIRGDLLGEGPGTRDAPARMADSTARSLGGGIRTRFTLVAKDPKSSPPAMFANQRLRRLTREAAWKRPEFPGERLSLDGL